jgi:hypothetical protein
MQIMSLGRAATVQEMGAYGSLTIDPPGRGRQHKDARATMASADANTRRPALHDPFREAHQLLCATHNDAAAFHVHDADALPLAQDATHRVE